jgi:23S rRNA (cytosine1962-C5)-methyltransferase
MQASETANVTWEGYALLASGQGKRMERWGTSVILRPESEAPRDWMPGIGLPEWDGSYSGDRAAGGRWEWRRPFPSPCVVSRGALSFGIRPTASKHLGLFPEQAANWDWIMKRIMAGGPDLRVLNLFGYTGGATLAAAAAGARVTHVDASRAMVSWCSENARLSGLRDAPVRYIVEDAMTFLRRELRRGNSYHGIVMDPPSYGRGRDGELWKLTDHLPSLLEAALEVLGESPRFLLLNTYSAPAEGEVKEITEHFLGSGPGRLERTELSLTGELDGRSLPCGTAHRWTVA